MQDMKLTTKLQSAGSDNGEHDFQLDGLNLRVRDWTKTVEWHNKHQQILNEKLSYS